MARVTKKLPKKKLPKRISVTEKIVDDISYHLEGDIDKAIDALIAWKKSAKIQKYTNVWIESDYTNYYGDDNNKILILKGERLQNDKEYHAYCSMIEKEEERTKQEKLKKEINERAEYERLKKKFA